MTDCDRIFEGQSLQVNRLEDGVAELCFDRKNQSVNKLDVVARAELIEATRMLQGESRVTGVCVTSAKETFIAGADLFEFPSLFAKSHEDITVSLASQAAVLTAFANLPFPTLAAINGLALGGGFEMALACDYRVMAEAARVGLPEVTLGILPGYGGTVRLPRLIGAAAALAWISTGGRRTAEAAFAAGAVDAIAPMDSLRERALAKLREAIVARDWQSRRAVCGGAAAISGLTDEVAKVKTASARTRTHFPAAPATADLISATAPLSRDDALRREAETFGIIAKTPAAQALVQSFVNEQTVKKQAKSLARNGTPVHKAGVLGAGIMGVGIAYSSALRGISVLLKDLSVQALELGRQEARKLLDKRIASGRMGAGQACDVLRSITTTNTDTGFGEVDIVIEAIVESPEVKKSVLKTLESHLKPDAVIASNTSSLSITELGQACNRPERFVGMHFFNPVPVMPLVEVVRWRRSSDAALATVVAYAMKMGKTPIIVKDCPGFLVNRVLTAYCVGFLRLIHDGADFEQVDRVMEAFGWPMGPAYLQDVIGMDTGRHVFQLIAAAYPDRMRLDFPDALTLMVENMRLGQKNGRGFYRYEADPKGRPIRQSAPEAHELVASVQPQGRRSFTDEEIIDRLMLPMVIEAAVCREEDVASSVAEIDTALALGLGFPRQYGGALKYADIIGLKTLIESCERHASLGTGYRPTPRMRDMARSGSRFHG